MIVIVACEHYREGRRASRPMSLDDADAVITGDGEEFVWISVTEPATPDLTEFGRRFALPELAIEDALSAHERPKIDFYPETGLLFAVLRTARYDDTRESIAYREVSVFLSERFVITVRAQSDDELHRAQHAAERRPDLLRHGPSAVLWAILDTTIDDYGPVIAGLQQDVDEVEGGVFQGESASTERIYRLRGLTRDFARAVHPLLGPVDSIPSGRWPPIAQPLNAFFRDISDHLHLVDDQVREQRDSLSSILDANLALISLRQSEIANTQNDTVQVLTVIATIFLPLTFLTGFFGMNFGWLVKAIGPFWTFPAFGVGLLVVSTLAFGRWFRRQGLLTSAPRDRRG